MNKRFISVISLLLVVVMVFTACAAKDPVTPDAPITAEGKLSNFLTFESAEASKYFSTSVHLNDKYGQLVDNGYGYVIFLKETKDRFNNLTETYSVYSAEKQDVVFTITNTYADEWGWNDEFGNETYPEKVIDGVYILSDNGIPYINIDWIKYTRIDDAVIAEEKLPWSYTEEFYSEFYDVTGKYIATSHVTDSGDEMASNEYCTVVSFGRTVAVFNNETYEVISTYDGDVEATPRLYDFVNDEYNYMLNVPSAGVSESVNPYLALYRTKIMVYDNDGNLVLHYVHGDDALMRNVNVLASGDILIQNVVATEAIEYDFLFGGCKANLDTFILDVETGALTELADFKYAVSYVYFAEDYLEIAPEGVKTTENVRNIAIAKDIVTDKEYTVFFDNFGNVNFVFDGKLAYEMDKEESLSFRVLSKDRLLVDLSSGVADRAIIDNDGNVVAYLTDAYIVLDDYIACVNDDYTIDIYDFDLKLVDTMDDDWADYYFDTEKGEYIRFFAATGNILVFDARNVYTSSSDSEPEITNYVVRVNIHRADYTSTSNATCIAEYGEDSNKLILISKESKVTGEHIYLVLSAQDRVILTVSASSSNIVYNEDGVAVMIFDGEVYVFNSQEYKDDYNPDNYNPDKDPDKDEDPDDDDDDDDDNDDEGGDN